MQSRKRLSRHKTERRRGLAGARVPSVSHAVDLHGRLETSASDIQFIKSTHKFGKYLQDVYDNTTLSMIQVKGRAFHQPREHSSYIY